MSKCFNRSCIALAALVAIAGCNNETSKKEQASNTTTATTTTAGTSRDDGRDQDAVPGAPPGVGSFGGPERRGPEDRVPGPGRRNVDWTAKVAAADKSKLPPLADMKDVTFEKDIRPLFETACLRCHRGDRARGKLHLDTLDGVLQGGEHGKAVIAGKSADSPLVIASAHIDPDLAMPPSRGPGGPGPGFGGPGGGRGGDRRGGPGERPEGGGPGDRGPSGGPGGNFGDRPDGGPGGPAGRDSSSGRGPDGGPDGPPRGFGPPGGFGPPKPLTAEQVGLVRAWIDQGAK